MPRYAVRNPRFLRWAVLTLACIAGVALRYAILERRSPRAFSYTIESCFRYRYAEMRMLGRPVPSVDTPAQWPEGFDVDRTMFPFPDQTAALVYRLRGGDPFLASRATIILFSVLAVLAFAPLAFAVFRRLWPAAAATLLYAGSFAAYSRSFGNYLREDFAMPGLLIAAAGTVYLLTGAGRLRWPALGIAAAAIFWAGSCWHMTQFAVAVLGGLVFLYAIAGRSAAAAQAGGALWLGLMAAALVNEPLWSKGAIWNLSSAVTLAPAAGYLAAKLLRRESLARWIVAGAGVVLGITALLVDPSQDYGHVFALLWAKVKYLGIKPEPSQLTFDARLYWVGPYNSPGRSNLVLEYGVLFLASVIGLGWAIRDLIRRHPMTEGTRFAMLALPVYLVLSLLMVRLTIFVAPWSAVLSLYPAIGGKGPRWRWGWLAPLGLLWLVHLNGIEGFWRPGWYTRSFQALVKAPVEVAWFYGSERYHLLQWMAKQAGAGAVLTDFSFSPTILYLAGKPTPLHPMFEVPPEVRRKTLAYAEAAVADEETFYALCSRWRVRYVVHFAPQVLDRGGGSFYSVTGKLPDFGSAAWLMQFAPQRLKRLRLVFETYTTRVYEVGTPYDGFVPVRSHPLFDSGRFSTIPAPEVLRAFYEDVLRAHALFTRTVSLQEKRDWRAAAVGFKEVLRIHPDYEDAPERLAACDRALRRR